MYTKYIKYVVCNLSLSVFRTTCFYFNGFKRYNIYLRSINNTFKQLKVCLNQETKRDAYKYLFMRYKVFGKLLASPILAGQNLLSTCR